MKDLLQGNLARVHDRLAGAAARAKRDLSAITLVAVSKTHPVEALLAAYELGVRHFGENRVEEAATKLPAFRQAISDPAVVFHMIGHLQSRKADDAVILFDRVHSVDSVKLAQRLSRFATKPLPILLEVNVSGEESKYGFDSARRDELFNAVEAIAQLSNLHLDGLMTMAPLVEDPEQTRPVFRALRELRDELEARYSSVKLPQLSMGMTNDFEVAIEEGATLIRIGRAIFGERK
ncbi:MAG TPA: YggS family pyridoxal phosphate-dependent enzyme [Anaerolineae bacterium]|nr:YggS family pyridoxal phosphate-dependent enzyme [Anaerolineae bacterium]